MTARCAVVVVVLLVASLRARAADEWSQFLGPSRNGIATAETGLLDSWPGGGPKEVWRAEGGVGMSGLSIAGGHLCTLVQRDGQQWLIALDPLSGQPRWQKALGPEY